MNENNSDTMSTNFTFNCVHILESFKDGELKKGKEIYEDILRWEEMKNPGFHVYYHDVVDADDFHAHLEQVHESVESSGALPIIHIEAHGCEQGLELKNRDFVQWTDIKEKLTAINIATKNNLLVTLGSCKGAFIIDTMKPTERTPMFGFIGFLHNITFETSGSAFSSFYKDILHKQFLDGFISGYGFDRNANENTPLFFSCIYFFMVVFDRYVKKCYNNTDDIVSRVMRIHNEATHDNQTPCVGIDEIAAGILNVESQFNRYKAKFLMIDLYRENLARFPQQYADISRYIK